MREFWQRIKAWWKGWRESRELRKRRRRYGEFF